MKEMTPSLLLSRRDFLAQSVPAAAMVVAVGGRGSAGAAVRGDTNPYAYSVARHETTDPALIGYAERRRIALPVKEARRLSVTPAGNLLVAAGSRLTEVDTAGNVVREFLIEAPIRCVTAAADGTVYAGFRDHLEVFTADGQRTAVWDKQPGRSWFTGIAVTENTVFAADAGQRVVLRYDRTGKVLGRIGERDRERDILGLVLPSPYLDVEWHADGLVRVNNPGRHRVEFYTPEGGLELAWGRPTAAIEGFSGCCNPINLAVLPDGRIVTCEKGLPRVKVYSAHGDLECVVAGTETFPENAQVGAGDGFGATAGASLDAAVGADGQIFVLDTVTATVRVMEPKPRGSA